MKKTRKKELVARFVYVDKHIWKKTISLSYPSRNRHQRASVSS